MDRNRKALIKDLQNIRSESISTNFFSRLGNPKFYRGRRYPVAWGRITIDKFSERVLPVVAGGPSTKNTIPEVRRAITNALWFGNSSLIVELS